MKKTLTWLGLALAIASLFAYCKKKNELDDVDCSAISATYTNNIKPIINAKCITSGCHDAGSSKGDYTTYNGLKAVADNGSLDNKTVKSNSMPPSGGCSMDERKKIKCWLQSGAPNN